MSSLSIRVHFHICHVKLFCDSRRPFIPVLLLPLKAAAALLVNVPALQRLLFLHMWSLFWCWAQMLELQSAFRHEGLSDASPGCPCFPSRRTFLIVTESKFLFKLKRRQLEWCEELMSLNEFQSAVNKAVHAALITALVKWSTRREICPECSSEVKTRRSDFKCFVFWTDVRKQILKNA